MEELQEGLIAAAATRAIIKEKKRLLEKAHSQPVSKRQAIDERNCKHQVALPNDYAPIPLNEALHGTIENPAWSGVMAKDYEFKLDPFQATAVACIERNESVLVAAHTSAGKTAVAEYAIAKALNEKQRVVYTSPLKALSNQKFRELSEEFGDVGLMTGDVTIKPNASCVVMTTEIFRHMIYQGSDLLREVSWVVFDEVHYMQDRERGVVWEEVIIFMPKEMRMVFLSATLPNAMEFADWVASVHGFPCHVVYTDYRPTPLVHYGFPVGGDGFYLLVNGKGEFQNSNFEKLKAAFPRQESKEKGKSTVRQPSSLKNQKTEASIEKDLVKILKRVMDQKWDPVIVFSFSRRDCEQYAGTLCSEDQGVNFNNEEEAASVTEIFTNALLCLSEEDRDLPYVRSMLPMLQKGIGVHHSGLLPLLKELVEVLFQEQLVKCLFSTETFAMGLNMPAKSVIFTALKKWDGQENRWVGSGEYIQMSGRAGRRGKDDCGRAFMIVDSDLDEATCRAMTSGKASQLNSSFKLSYYTLLNLLRRTEEAGRDMEYVISHSFSQFQYDRKLPELQESLMKVEKEAASITVASNAEVEEYVNLKKDRVANKELIRCYIQKPEFCLHFLRPGRVIRVSNGSVEWGYGVVVTVIRQDLQGPSRVTAAPYTVDVLLCFTKGADNQATPTPVVFDQKAEMHVVSLELSAIQAISSLRLSLPPDLHSAEARHAVLLTLQELVKKHSNAILPMLDPVADFGIKDQAVKAAVKSLSEIEERLQSHPISKISTGLEATDVEKQLHRKSDLLTKAAELKKRMRESQLTSFNDEFKRRMSVLTKLGHLNSAGLVSMKGTAASEINTADELLATELMFNGTFNALDPAQVAAVLSCLVPVEKSQKQPQLVSQLADPLTALQQAARYIASIEKECKVDVDEEAYLQSFRPHLMDVVYSWSKGASFKQICDDTDMFEGTIIRALRRLAELLQELINAAKVVGDERLSKLFTESSESLRRGLPFSASLYL